MKPKTKNGYNEIKKPEHHRSHTNGYVYEHIIIIEQILGKPLNSPHCVHHINGIKSDNLHSNLIVCENEAYHKILHKRQRSIKATGSPHYRHCWDCKTWKHKSSFGVGQKRCLACTNKWWHENKHLRNEIKRNKRKLLRNQAMSDSRVVDKVEQI